jgi:hypothetical protein
LLTPAIKYWVCKSAPGFLYEAMECLGGNGYVEEGILARHYREAPVNAIWEGSGNVMCLDVLRRSATDGEGGARGSARSPSADLQGAGAAARVRGPRCSPDAEAGARGSLAPLLRRRRCARARRRVAELFAAPGWRLATGIQASDIRFGEACRLLERALGLRPDRPRTRTRFRWRSWFVRCRRGLTTRDRLARLTRNKGRPKWRLFSGKRHWPAGCAPPGRCNRFNSGRGRRTAARTFIGPWHASPCGATLMPLAD